MEIQEIKNLINDYLAKEAEYEEARTIANGLKEEMDRAYYKIIDAMSSEGLQKFSSEFADISLLSRMRVTVPKEAEDKKSFFEYVRRKYGEDVLIGILTVNHNTLNSFYNSEISSGGEIIIPGISSPVEEKYLRISRKRT